MNQRKPFVVANWKMNGDLSLVNTVSARLQDETGDLPEILICPPVLFLANFPKSAHYQLGAQNLSEHTAGAFTGEISAVMLAELGATYVIVGHSERRTLFGETNEQVAQKVNQAIAAGLTPILCVGETLEQRTEEKTFSVLAEQLDAVYSAQPQWLADSVVAYEPVWAIGTGQTASPEQVQEVHEFIRQHLQRYNSTEASKLRIIYGGSVNASNSRALFAQMDVDGALVGGASLKATEFVAICLSAKGE